MDALTFIMFRSNYKRCSLIGNFGVRAVKYLSYILNIGMMIRYACCRGHGGVHRKYIKKKTPLSAKIIVCLDDRVWSFGQTQAIAKLKISEIFFLSFSSLIYITRDRSM